MHQNIDDYPRPLCLLGTRRRRHRYREYGLGLLIALRYSPVRLWPHRQLNIFRLHNWTAYSVLLLIVLHPAVLLLGRSTRFGLADVLLPIQSPVQPKLNTVGAAASYALLIVIVTSLFRLRMARPLWRKLHYLVFPAFILMFIHSVFTDPTLSNGKVDFQYPWRAPKLESVNASNPVVVGDKVFISETYGAQGVLLDLLP